MDQQWIEAAGQHGKRIAPQHRVVRIEIKSSKPTKKRPFFYPVGTYWQVKVGRKVVGKLFSDRFEANRLRDRLNGEKRKPKGARTLPPTELRTGRREVAAKSRPNPDKTSTFNRGLTVRPKPGIKSA